MDGLQAIAAAHYESGTQRVRDLAHDFFNSLDMDGDGEVDYDEFLMFMRGEGYGMLSSRYVFSELDTDGDGALDFWEVMTLYYIIKSGRPFCVACGELVTGVFFTCVACYRSPRTYDLCLTCYGNGMYSHNHNGRSQFLDSYTMLFDMRNSSMNARTGNQNQMSNAIVPAQRAQMSQSRSANYYQVQPQPPTSNVIIQTTANYYQVQPQPPTSNAIIPAPRRNRMSSALRVFEIALGIGNISSSLCTIL